MEYPGMDQFVDEYACSKAVGEKAVLKANGREGAGGQRLYTCSIRPSAVFDGRDRKLGQGLLEKISSNVMFSGGKDVIDFVWAVDLARAHVEAATVLAERRQEIAGKAIHVGGDSPKQTKDFFGTRDEANPWRTIWGQFPPFSLPFTMILGVATFNFYTYRAIGIAPVDFFLRPDSIRFVGGRSFWFDGSRAKQILGYEPTPLAKAVKIIRDEYAMIAKAYK